MRTTYPELEPKVAKALANVALEYNATRLRPVFGQIAISNGVTSADDASLGTVIVDAPLAGCYLTVGAMVYLKLTQIDAAWKRFGVGFMVDSAVWRPDAGSTTNALATLTTQAVVGATPGYFTLGYQRTHVLAQGRHVVDFRWYKPDGHGAHGSVAIVGQIDYTLSLWVPTQTRL